MGQMSSLIAIDRQCQTTEITWKNMRHLCISEEQYSSVDRNKLRQNVKIFCSLFQGRIIMINSAFNK